MKAKNNSYRTNIFLDSVKDPNKPVSLYIEVKPSEGKPFRISTGQQVLKRDWNNKGKEVRRSNSKYSNLNELLKARITEIENACLELLTQKNEITKQAIESIISYSSTEPKKDHLIEALDKWISARKNEVSASTLEKYNFIKKILIAFSDHTGNELSFSAINETFYTDFKEYCYTERGNHDNGLSGHIKNLKVFLNWATDQGLNKKLDYKKFSVPKEDKDIFPLHQDEIETLEKASFKKENNLKEVVKDRFLFSCYTGLRYSDVEQLKPENIEGRFIKLKAYKTKQRLRIPLLPKALALIKKHEGETRSKGRVFPSITNQKSNEYLKAIFKAIELNRPVSYQKQKGKTYQDFSEKLHEVVHTHMGRQTFVTHCLRNGMGHFAIMEITGHENWENFKRYVNFQDSDLENQLKRAWKIPEKQLKKG